MILSTHQKRLLEAILGKKNMFKQNSYMKGHKFVYGQIINVRLVPTLSFQDTTLTSPCNEHPGKSHCISGKGGVCWGMHYFSLLKNIVCEYS